MQKAATGMFSHDGHYARRAAEEHVHRQAHATRWEAELLHQLHHDELDAPRILATDQLEEVVGDRLDGQIGTGRVGLPPAVEALVGFHLDQAAGVAAGIGDVGLDGADLHVMSPSDGAMAAIQQRSVRASSGQPVPHDQEPWKLPLRLFIEGL